MECKDSTSHVPFRLHKSTQPQPQNCVIVLTQVRRLGSVDNTVQTLFPILPSALSAHKTRIVLNHGPGSREITGEMNSFSGDP